MNLELNFSKEELSYYESLSEFERLSFVLLIFNHVNNIAPLGGGLKELLLEDFQEKPKLLNFWMLLLIFFSFKAY